MHVQIVQTVGGSVNHFRKKFNFHFDETPSVYLLCVWPATFWFQLGLFQRIESYEYANKINSKIMSGHSKAKFVYEMKKMIEENTHKIHSETRYLRIAFATFERQLH